MYLWHYPLAVLHMDIRDMIDIKTKTLSWCGKLPECLSMRSRAAYSSWHSRFGEYTGADAKLCRRSGTVLDASQSRQAHVKNETSTALTDDLDGNMCLSRYYLSGLA